MVRRVPRGEARLIVSVEFVSIWLNIEIETLQDIILGER